MNVRSLIASSKTSIPFLPVAAKTSKKSSISLGTISNVSCECRICINVICNINVDTPL